MFAAEAGFVSFRPVRRMGFVTYDSEKHASFALKRLQGLQAQEGSRPLMLSFDAGTHSDHTSYQEKRRKELVDVELAGTVPYVCVACGSEILRLDASWPLLSSPRRSSDASHAVEEKVALRRLLVAKAPVVNVWRAAFAQPSTVESRSPAGTHRAETDDRAAEGVESGATSREEPGGRMTAGGSRSAEARHMLHCPRCDVPVAYRARPLGEAAKFLFVLDGALTARAGGSADNRSLAAVSGEHIGNDHTEGERDGSAEVAPPKAPASSGR